MQYGEELRNVQLTILSIFKEIVRICDDNNITYFIIAGTALGALRHGGFIPWDDDLDIGMTRENYNKFLEVAKNQLPSDLFLQTIDTDPDTIFYFAKVRKTGTKFVEKYCRNLNIHQGVYVDIFPFDNIPDDLQMRKKHYRRVDFWSNLFIAKCVTGTSVPQHGLSGFIKLSIRFILHFLLKPLSKLYLYSKWDLATQQYNQVTCRMVSYVKNQDLQIPKEDVENCDDIYFENINVKCPGHLEKYLRHNYGDYMKLPPEEKRYGHRPFKLEI